MPLPDDDNVPTYAHMAALKVTERPLRQNVQTDEQVDAEEAAAAAAAARAAAVAAGTAATSTDGAGLVISQMSLSGRASWGFLAQPKCDPIPPDPGRSRLKT